MIMQIEPPEIKPKGDLDNQAVEIIGMDEIGIDGHILISSDNQIFINRCLLEMSHRSQKEKIVVLKILEPCIMT